MRWRETLTDQGGHEMDRERWERGGNGQNNWKERKNELNYLAIFESM